MTKVALLIPTRGDRPEFLKNCMRQIETQTVQPDHIELVDDVPTSHQADIMWRYRTGYDRLRGKGFDIIFFWEDDDFYQPFYIEEMLKEWEAQDRPNLFGTRYTIYYHIMLQKYHTMRHDDRASAMNTMIKPDMTFPWGNDADPFADMWLWFREEFDRKLFLPKRILAVGMKHGLTMTGGKSHVDRYKQYINDDNGFLRNTLTEDSYNFFFQLGEKMRSGELKQYGK